MPLVDNGSPSPAQQAFSNHVILSELAVLLSSADLHATSLVSKAFNTAVLPHLYRRVVIRNLARTGGEHRQKSYPLPFIRKTLTSRYTTTLELHPRDHAQCAASETPRTWSFPRLRTWILNFQCCSGPPRQSADEVNPPACVADCDACEELLGECPRPTRTVVRPCLFDHQTGPAGCTLILPIVRTKHVVLYIPRTRSRIGDGDAEVFAMHVMAKTTPQVVTIVVLPDSWEDPHPRNPNAKVKTFDARQTFLRHFTKYVVWNLAAIPNIAVTLVGLEDADPFRSATDWKYSRVWASYAGQYIRTAFWDHEPGDTEASESSDEDEQEDDAEAEDHVEEGDIEREGNVEHQYNSRYDTWEYRHAEPRFWYQNDPDLDNSYLLQDGDIALVPSLDEEMLPCARLLIGEQRLPWFLEHLRVRTFYEYLESGDASDDLDWQLVGRWLNACDAMEQAVREDVRIPSSS